MPSNLQPKALTLALQAAYLKKYFPAATVEIRKSNLRWLADLQPTTMSQSYKVCMEYNFRQKRPKVWVLAPKLKLPSIESDVHVFRADKTLCLYFRDEWTRSQLLADTIVPWISEWLFHYEVWLVTGEWHGGGIHLGKQTAIRDAA